MFYKKNKKIKILTQIFFVFIFFVSSFFLYKETRSESASWWYVNLFDNVMGIKGVVVENNSNNNTGYPTKNNCEEWRTSYINQLPTTTDGSMGQKYTKQTLPGCFLSTYEDLSKNKPVFSNIGTEPISVTPQAGSGEEVDPNTYKLLAPIGDFEEITTNNIGDYFNKFFLLAIGLAAALSVIMLIIGGVQWMGTDSVFGKTEAKKQITQAILGLLIAIGSYALLNTINPDLLGKRGLSVDRLSIEIEKEDVPWAQYSSGGSIALCPEGFTNVADGGTPAGVINVCKSIASNLEKLIADAKKENILLSGYGSRSEAQQRALRIKNGCPDIENSPAEDCNPPTARIGRSMHESGKAIDFRCNGKSMMESGGKNSPCFKWLANNAHNYGLKNLASEPWHWSTTGR